MKKNSESAAMISSQLSRKKSCGKNVRPSPFFPSLPPVEGGTGLVAVVDASARALEVRGPGSPVERFVLDAAC